MLCQNASTTAAPQCGEPPIIVRHPHYPEHQSTLLRFPRLDAVSRRDEVDCEYTYGVHHGTVLSACQIITGNASTAYLSHDHRGKMPVRLSYDGILTYGQYFLHVPQGESSATDTHSLSLPLSGIDDLHPFAVICDFEDWQFPHDGIPEAWTSFESVPVVAASPTYNCALSGGLSTEPAYLVPHNQSSWFHQNRMGDYIANRGEDFGPGNASNICRLHKDLLKDFNCRAFALVPKMSRHGYRLVAHYLSTSDDLLYPANVFHNQEAYQLERYTVEYLYARFAYTIFGLIRTFTEQKRRVAVIEPGRNEFRLCTWVTKVYWMSPEQVAARRTQLANQPLKKRNLSESGINTERQHGPKPFRPLLTEHGQSRPLLDPGRPILTQNRALHERLLHHSHRRARSLTFDDLPPEVRLQIWEATWPRPRLIGAETVELDNQSTDDIEDFARLQILGSMESWLKAGETRQMLKHDRYPVALSVCAESRRHTMKHFTLIHHHEHIEWSFYLNPALDILWASDDLWNLEEEDITNLSRAYGRQLTCIKKLILDAESWRDVATLEILRYLGGIEVIQLRLDDDASPTVVTELLQDLGLQFRNDNRYCSRFQLIDQSYRIRGEFETGKYI
ncbi:hypothetical protein BFJ71_g16173 [Fusarium oxysporum]|nr:hypothetical protein BFJ71_g16173 [Fusarium oxysporum]